MAVEPPHMTVQAVESIETLDADQNEMLAEALEERRELRRADLVVYRMADGRAVVAPRSAEIGPGSHVLATGWTDAWQQADSEGNSAEIHVAARLALDADF
jgi:hypothetical protein